ncbi:MAG: NADH-quinone oxidoreductase subunit [Solirubrobacteraceae bacterium]|nr:NADH-quinone oxidoreductase subunit [Solirubrobacteraceae bacterium]
MAEVVFFIAAIGAIAGAVGTVALRNPFYSVLALVGHLLCLAALFLLLRAAFVAAAQVVVYAGAVMVLYVFVSAYIGRVDHAVGPNPGPALKGLSFAFAGVLLVEFFIAILGTSLDALDTKGAGYFEASATRRGGFGSPSEIGRLLLTDYLLAFEVASFLLLVAAVGAVILARRREGLEPTGTLSVGDLFSKTTDAGTIDSHEEGSMLEAGGSPGR